MSRIAIIEDVQPVSDGFRDLIVGAKPGTEIHQFQTRASAENAIKSNAYDLFILDIALGSEQNAGIGLISNIHKVSNTPVLVVSGLSPELYRPLMEELDAWDYLPKPVDPDEFVGMVLEILKSTSEDSVAGGSMAQVPLPLPPKPQQPQQAPNFKMSVSLLKQPSWNGKRLNLPMTALKILAALVEAEGKIVSYQELFDLVKSGKNRGNVRQHIRTIRQAFDEAQKGFDPILTIPMTGFMWNNAPPKTT